MISSEVERTLVKSPPELWAELSDPTSLSRHLGELGEIRIVRTEPESTVEWTAENTTGTVSLKPSGWGTKVTLSVTRELDEPTEATPGPASAASAPELTPAPAPEPTPEPEPAQAPEAALEPGPTQDARPEPEPEPEPVLPEPTAAMEPEPVTVGDPAPSKARRGFFARLFGRRRAQAREPAGSVEQTAPADEPPRTTTEPLSADRVPPTTAPAPAIETNAEANPSSEPGDAFAAIREALAPETFAVAHLFATRPGLGRREPTGAPVQVQTQAPLPPSQPQTTPATDASQPSQAPSESLTANASTPPEEPAVDIAAELLAAEEVASEQVTAVLTAVLDRLGAAHHRPFSRA